MIIKCIIYLKGSDRHMSDNKKKGYTDKDFFQKGVKSDIVKSLLNKANVSQTEIASYLGCSVQSFRNKMNRDKFSTIELVEIADALEMNLILKDKADGTEYVIDYPEDEKGKSKRNMTEEEKKAAQKKSEATKARNAKKQAESQDN